MSSPGKGTGSGGSGGAASTSTSGTLLAKVRADEPAAWERLVKLYAPLVHGWCRSWKLQPADAADVFQEVFQAVARHIRTFRRERTGDTFRGWLRTITRHKVLDHFRRLASEPQGAGGTEAQARLSQLPAPEEVEEAPAADDGEEGRLYFRCLELIRAEFEERTWKAFWGTAVDSRPAKDVAEDLSMSPGAVRVARCRVLRRLREELGDTPA